MRTEQIGFKSIGTNYLLSKTNLKKDLLYFDKIIFDTKELERSLWMSKEIGGRIFGKNEFKKLTKFKMSELKFLEDRGLVEGFDSDRLELVAHHSDLSNFLKNFKNFKEEINIASIFRSINMSQVENFEEHSFRTIFISSLLNYLSDGLEVIPVVDELNLYNNLPITKEFKIVQVVLNKFPVIDDKVNWEEIIDFKQNEDFISDFLSLRNWMIDIGKGTYSVREISEKLDYLYNQYKRHLERYKIKTKRGVMKSFIITSTEIMENLITIKWSKAVSTLIDLFEVNSKLLNIKANAPGKEVAYIYSLNKEFDN